MVEVSGSKVQGSGLKYSDDPSSKVQRFRKLTIDFLSMQEDN
jgi:hypothetical protein